MNQSSDKDIRIALHKKVLKKYHDCADTFVIDELGLAHGRNRIDIAVLNGCLHGYEIKSAKDTLQRFQKQLLEYSKSLQKLTVVAAPQHVDELLEHTPKWCGITIAEKGPRGGISFSSLRKSSKNPSVDPVAVAHLLWKKEALEFLEKIGEVEASSSRKSRKVLYQEIAVNSSLDDLVAWVKQQFMKREAWRADLRPV